MRVERLWDEIRAAARPEVVLRARLERGNNLPGFGHPMYPDGDVRAAAILNRIPERSAHWRSLTYAVEQFTGLKPHIEFALVALRRHLRLPAGSAIGLFALGRSLGWIAHALEQRAQGKFHSASRRVHRSATGTELIINLKTTKALGITIPQSILVRANRVIE